MKPAISWGKRIIPTTTAAARYNITLPNFLNPSRAQGALFGATLLPESHAEQGDGQSQKPGTQSRKERAGGAGAERDGESEGETTADDRDVSLTIAASEAEMPVAGFMLVSCGARSRPL